MSVAEELAGLSPKKETLLAVGVFDGVHLGHKSLLAELTRQAKERDFASGVITFRQHPGRLLSEENTNPYLTSLSQKIKLIEDEGVDFVVTLSFDASLAQTGAHEFCRLLQKHLRMRGLVIGADFALGRNREGNTETLALIGKSMDFSVTVVPPVKTSELIISSTAIRQALSEGDMAKVRHMTGRYFQLDERVITGEGRGASLGFPTANLDVDTARALPSDGVYASRAYVNEQSYQAVTNIGQRPTFCGSDRTVEVYIIDYKGDLYSSALKVDIIEKLRGEICFKSAGELTSQIEKDIIKAKEILSTGERN